MEGAFGVVVLASREAPGTPLLHAARTALLSGACEVVVVVGSEAARRSLRSLPVRALVLKGGRGDAIAAGIAALGVRVEKAVVTLANRVRVRPEHLRALAAAVEGRRSIVASAYDGTVGAPTAFARSEFSRLEALSGDEGARALLNGAATIVFSGGNVRTAPPARSNVFVGATPLRAAARRLQTSRAPPTGTLTPFSARP